MFVGFDAIKWIIVFLFDEVPLKSLTFSIYVDGFLLVSKDTVVQRQCDLHSHFL